MYDEKKIKRFKTIVGIVVAVLIFIVAYSVGHYTANAGGQAKNVPQKVTASKNELSRSTVEKFDLAFFTKKDLGENRNRYKDLMTEAMYNQEVAEENKPVNQAYKGMVIDQALKSQNIYIDQKNNTALVDVEYTNTQLKEPGNLKTALKDQNNNATLKLSFVKQGKKYLVNEIKWVSLVEAGSSSTNSGSVSFSSSSSSSSAGTAASSSSTTSSSAASSSSDDNDTNNDLAASYQLW
ncbi:hypothetical protein WOSG25_090300 [Weissella oryzae SG25]|uniref:Parvulin-like peptidyl-prolyl isomerase n=1 Tax=Weissella oryzae (strain DSM 25784 / JCM 18191 / LMG 30913 / SG25) TaxID=1329250 RepID=A0A069CVV4_WEIOS|nr:hypothetical protein [Weissella oryzae]GAK31333.1 hypothetical protein WOSG25_090300 [Weissella oryzae SG25]